MIQQRVRSSSGTDRAAQAPSDSDWRGQHSLAWQALAAIRDSAPGHSAVIGAVVIGRNEGERLRACLESIAGRFACVVYVDSGSTDGSPAFAHALSAEVVDLDPSRGFTAARARNAGFERLKQRQPDVEFVQFIDGDCVLDPDWLGSAANILLRFPTVAVVCGRRRERHAATNRYSRLCDIEWDTPVGEADACGGDALMRVTAFEQATGFDPNLIAGEEPDLCHRMRRADWKVLRIPVEMTLHDAAMTRISQWWRRNKRGGYACAEAMYRRGHQEPGLRRQVVSNYFWASPLAWPLWPVLWVRVARRKGALYACHIVAGKVPNALGQLAFRRVRANRVRSALIEYK